MDKPGWWCQKDFDGVCDSGCSFALVSSIMIRLEWGSYSEDNTMDYGNEPLLQYYMVASADIYSIWYAFRGKTGRIRSCGIFRTMLIVLSVIGFVSWLKIQSVKYSSASGKRIKPVNRRIISTTLVWFSLLKVLMNYRSLPSITTIWNPKNLPWQNSHATR